ncbi:hypothetical protein Pfo_018809 [Paulownia fortunei]|nr:hypothetical protein Pfo_018809 [Paulownia fortunei]
MEEDETEESLADSMICDSGSRLVPYGLKIINCIEEIVLFVNAGATGSVESDAGVNFLADKFLKGEIHFKLRILSLRVGTINFFSVSKIGKFLLPH